MNVNLKYYNNGFISTSEGLYRIIDKNHVERINFSGKLTFHDNTNYFRYPRTNSYICFNKHNKCFVMTVINKPIALEFYDYCDSCRVNISNKKHSDIITMLTSNIVEKVYYLSIQCDKISMSKCIREKLYINDSELFYKLLILSQVDYIMLVDLIFWYNPTVKYIINTLNPNKIIKINKYKLVQIKDDDKKIRRKSL